MGKSVFKALSKFGGSKIMDPLGINKSTGLVTPVENMLAGEVSPLDGLTGAATIRAAAQTDKQNLALQAQQDIIQQNATKLASNSAQDNTVQSEVGGTADSMDASDLIKKRGQGGSLSSTLGI